MISGFAFIIPRHPVSTFAPRSMCTLKESKSRRAELRAPGVAIALAKVHGSATCRLFNKKRLENKD